MPLDPSFRITRTDAGNAELSKPTNGLSIGQRKILTFLDTPQAIGPLLASRELEPEKFERDLAKLRLLKLVDVPGMPALDPPVTVTRPGSRAAASRTPRAPNPGPMTAGSGPVAPTLPGTTFAGTPTLSGADAPVVLGGGRPAMSPRLLFLGVALAIVGALAYMTFATSPGDHAATVAANPPTQGTMLPPAATPPAPALVALTTPQAVAPATTPPVASADAVRPVAATVLEGTSANGTQRKPDLAADARNDAQRKADLAAAARNDARTDTRSAPAESRNSVADAHTAAADPKTAAVPAPSAVTAQPKVVPVVAAPLPAAVPAAVAVPVVATSAASPARVPAATAAGGAKALPEPSLAQAPPVQLAAAAPDAATAHPPAAIARPVLNDLTPISREQPDFPREAIAAGVTKGTVKARITVDAGGKVSSVSIVDAQPRRVFDRAVSQALAQWTFNPGPPSRTTDVTISFDRE